MLFAPVVRGGIPGAPNYPVWLLFGESYARVCARLRSLAPVDITGHLGPGRPWLRAGASPAYGSEPLLYNLMADIASASSH